MFGLVRVGNGFNVYQQIITKYGFKMKFKVFKRVVNIYTVLQQDETIRGKAQLMLSSRRQNRRTKPEVRYRLLRSVRVVAQLIACHSSRSSDNVSTKIVVAIIILHDGGPGTAGLEEAKFSGRRDISGRQLL